MITVGGHARPMLHDLGHDPIAAAFGAGVDSTALLIGLEEAGIRPDLIMFANTGSEKPQTIIYLDVMDRWLANVGFPPITRLKRGSPRAGDTSLHDGCLRKSVLPSLAYGGHSCSLKRKVEPQWAYTRGFFGWNTKAQRFSHGPTITKLIGYDAGPADGRRIAKAVGKWPPGHTYRYPLQEWGWTREDCEHVVRAAGLPVPIKSACFMCPASRKPEVDWLATEHPDLVAVSIEMERRAHRRGLTTTKGLGRRWSWSEYLGHGDPAQHTEV